MSQPKVVDYYFAPMSGYAYLGHNEFVDLCAKAGVEIRYHPLDMARVFAAAGSFPPAKYSDVRQVHRKADMTRWAEMRGLHFNATPAFWPVPMALACAVITAAGRLGIDQAAVTKAMLSAVWVHDLNISDHESVGSALTLHDLPKEQLMSAAGDPATIDLAEQITAQAIDKCIFGSPTYVFGEDWYFGQDRLAFLQRHFERTAG